MSENTTRPFILIVIIGLLPIVMVLGNSMFIPILPYMQVELAMTTVQAGLILTIFSIPSALFIPISGVLSDTVGKRKMAMLSLVVVMVGCVVSAFGGVFHSISWMLVGRFIQGIGAGGVTPIAMVLASELFAKEQRNQALASIESFNGVGKVISPIIGGLVLLGVWYYSFVVYFAVAFMAWVGMYLFIPSQKTSGQKTGGMKKAFAVMKEERRLFIPVLTASGVGMFLLFGFLFLLSYEWEFAFQTNGLMKGMALSIPLLILTVASIVVGKYRLKSADQIKGSIVIGLGVISLASLLFIFSMTMIVDLLLTSVLALGLGFLLPGCSASIAAVVEREVKGKVFSLYAMVRFLGVAFGPTVFGVWMHDREQMMFNVFLLAGVTCVILLWNWTCLPVGKQCETQQTS
ncbi:MFS transporter [Bacillus sp. FJAT-45037]|uniref:MFS transporter n=1 Tax=Bacillus sp. FJAT-45037 TaxID=2011007 RepID=UPI000C249DC3|nr:MFS transporter [Bacillus sp. FJAT-45037]